MIAFAGILAAGLAVAFVFGLIFFVLKLVFWAVFLPFRLLFKLLWIPFGLVTGAVGLAAGAALLPILLVVGGVVAVIGLFAAIIAVLIPAIPFLLLGLVVWAFMRRQPEAVGPVAPRHSTRTTALQHLSTSAPQHSAPQHSVGYDPRRWKSRSRPLNSCAARGAFTPTREGVVDGAQRWTYGEFFDRCDRWSSALQRLGVQAGRSRRLHRAEHPRAARIVLRGAATWRGPRAAQLPPGRRRLSLPDSAQRRQGGVRRGRSPRGGRFDSRRA